MLAISLFVRWRNKEENEECSKNFIKRSNLTSKGQACRGGHSYMYVLLYSPQNRMWEVVLHFSIGGDRKICYPHCMWRVPGSQDIKSYLVPCPKPTTTSTYLHRMVQRQNKYTSWFYAHGKRPIQPKVRHEKTLLLML